MIPPLHVSMNSPVLDIPCVQIRLGVSPKSAAGRKALLGFKREWSTFRDAVDHVIEGGKP